MAAAPPQEALERAEENLRRTLQSDAQDQAAGRGYYSERSSRERDRDDDPGRYTDVDDGEYENEDGSATFVSTDSNGNTHVQVYSIDPQNGGEYLAETRVIRADGSVTIREHDRFGNEVVGRRDYGPGATEAADFWTEIYAMAKTLLIPTAGKDREVVFQEVKAKVDQQNQVYETQVHGLAVVHKVPTEGREVEDIAHDVNVELAKDLGIPVTGKSREQLSTAVNNRLDADAQRFESTGEAWDPETEKYRRTYRDLDGDLYFRPEGLATFDHRRQASTLPIFAYDPDVDGPVDPNTQLYDVHTRGEDRAREAAGLALVLPEDEGGASAFEAARAREVGLHGSQAKLFEAAEALNIDVDSWDGTLDDLYQEVVRQIEARQQRYERAIDQARFAADPEGGRPNLVSQEADFYKQGFEVVDALRAIDQARFAADPEGGRRCPLTLVSQEPSGLLQAGFEVGHPGSPLPDSNRAGFATESLRYLNQRHIAVPEDATNEQIVGLARTVADRRANLDAAIDRAFAELQEARNFDESGHAVGRYATPEEAARIRTAHQEYGRLRSERDGPHWEREDTADRAAGILESTRLGTVDLGPAWEGFRAGVTGDYSRFSADTELPLDIDAGLVPITGTVLDAAIRGRDGYSASDVAWLAGMGALDIAPLPGGGVITSTGRGALRVIRHPLDAANIVTGGRRSLQSVTEGPLRMPYDLAGSRIKEQGVPNVPVAFGQDVIVDGQRLPAYEGLLQQRDQALGRYMATGEPQYITLPTADGGSQMIAVAGSRAATSYGTGGMVHTSPFVGEMTRQSQELAEGLLGRAKYSKSGELLPDVEQRHFLTTRGTPAFLEGSAFIKKLTPEQREIFSPGYQVLTSPENLADIEEIRKVFGGDVTTGQMHPTAVVELEAGVPQPVTIAGGAKTPLFRERPVGLGERRGGSQTYFEVDRPPDMQAGRWQVIQDNVLAAVDNARGRRDVFYVVHEGPPTARGRPSGPGI